jgi:hypothetical protein
MMLLSKIAREYKSKRFGIITEKKKIVRIKPTTANIGEATIPLSFMTPFCGSNFILYYSKLTALTLVYQLFF